MKKTYTMAEMKDQLKVLGRSKAYGTSISGDWSACGIEFAAHCKGDVAVTVTVITIPEDNYEAGSYFTVHVDGVRDETRYLATEGTHDIVIARDLPEGDHRFRIARQAHNTHCNLNYDAVTIDGELNEKPADRDFYIEFLGDSITCCWGVYVNPGDNPEAYPFSDGTSSYAFFAADELNADYSMVCRGSWGFMAKVPGCNIPDAYPYVCYSRNREDLYDFEAARKPDLIVINLGTNDSGWQNGDDKRAEFQAKVEAFLDDLLAKNGKKPILYVYNMMNLSCVDMVKEIFAKRGGEEAGYHTLELPREPSGHPQIPKQKEAGSILAEYVRAHFMK